MPDIKFIDLYSDNPFDPTKLLEDGYMGVVFKAGQGGWADVPRYKSEWWELARQYRLKRGWYWICDSRYKSSDHITEMKKFHVLESVGELGLWVDIEKPNINMSEKDYWKTPYAGYKNLVDFLYLITKEDVIPGIYTGKGAYELVMRGAPKTEHDYLSHFKLWTAQYPWNYTPGISKPSLYGSWKSWTWWQYREGPDVNLYYGTQEQFEDEYDGVFPPQPPPVVIIPTGDTMAFTTKGTARLATNLKPTVTGAGNIVILPIGGRIYGNDAGTDITGFTHYRLSNGNLIELGTTYKASKTNLIVTTETEPGDIPPPVTPPEQDRLLWQKSTDGGKTWVTYKPFVEVK